ncbi:MAG: efflux RND transporter periplasmic adaptor subunit [Gemmatimonadota bacterium]|nr:efflux RND transporter periplasmic adaptor subunit [Gemmatimonadota bacterium]MDE2986130.1 efflux RND transporter periplasmic adaptor subunit [Gemmatimonadota bacterium]
MRNLTRDTTCGRGFPRIARTGAAVLLLGALACEEAAETDGISIQSTPAEMRGMRITAEASGQLEPVLKVEVKSKASGEILELFVDSGDEVQEGDTLARVDPRDVKNAWDQAVADYQVARVRRDLAEEQRDRSRGLLAAEVITKQEFESRELEFANAEASFVRAETNRELADLRRADVTITAPMSGTILEKLVEYGQVIQSATQNVSGGTTLFMMANLDNMRVRTLVDETDVGKLAAGLPATVSVEAFPDRPFQGYIEKIEPQAIAQQNVTMFPVIVLLDNSSGLLKPGMNAEVEVLVDERVETLAVPNNAIVQPQEVQAAAEVLGMDPDATSIDFQAFGTLMGQAAARFAELGGSNTGRDAGAGRMAGGGFPGGRGGGFGGAAAGEGQGAEAADGEDAASGDEAAGGVAGEAAANGMSSVDEIRQKMMSGEISQDSARALFSAMRGQSGAGAGAAGGAAGRMNAGGSGNAGQAEAGAAAGGNRQGGGGGRPAGMGGWGGGGAGGAGRGAGGAGGGFGGMMAAMRGGNDLPYRPAVVFVIDDAGTIEARPVVIGLSDWDYVEVLAGLQAGEELALIGAAQLQARQQAQMERMRQRMRPF